jgi:hemerythrin
MTALAWTEDLRLNQPQMDRTHEEFVALLAQARAGLEAGDNPGALAGFERLLDHTVEHFAQEDRWMLATGFAPENCHTRQHATVLAVMREVVRLARDEARWEPLGVLVNELALWFPQHARMMDAGLAQHMADVGYDPATGVAAGVLPAQAITRCGSQGCG